MSPTPRARAAQLGPPPPAGALWRGKEPYTLILDSHHRFVRHWDQHLLEAHDDLLARGVEKPIVTAYLPPYDPRGDARRRPRTPLKIYPFERADGLLLRLIGRPILKWRAKASRSPASSSPSTACSKAAGAFNAEIRFDPQCCATSSATRKSGPACAPSPPAGTCFHPHRVIGWHCYDRVAIAPHTGTTTQPGAISEKVSLARLRKLLSGRRVDGYGAGDRRSLRDFEDRVMLRLCEAS